MPNLHAHHLVWATLLTFDRVCKAHALSDRDFPITPIRDTPDLPPGLQKSYLLAEWPQAQMLSKHFFYSGKFPSLQVLAQMSTTQAFPSWPFMQLKHFLNVPAKIAKYTRSSTVFESLCSSTSPQSHVISALYAYMFGELYSSLRSDHAFWKTALDREIGDASWDHIHLLIHKGSFNVNVQENGYKIKARWYKTPQLLH